MIRVLGLDLASHASGMVTDGHVASFTAKRNDELIERAQATRDAVDRFIQATGAPSLVVFEALGTRHVATAQAIATVRALVLDLITTKYGALVLHVQPATLKKFATGDGRASKGQMAAACPGSHDMNDDEVDAWWLWAFGRCLFNHPPDGVTLTADRIDILRRTACQ